MTTETSERHADRAVPLRTERDRAVAADASCFGPTALRALLEQLAVAVFMADRQGRLVYANAAARRDVAALPAAVGSMLARALLTGEVVRDEEIELADTTGRRRYASVSVTPLGAGVDEVEGGREASEPAAHDDGSHRSKPRATTASFAGVESRHDASNTSNPFASMRSSWPL